MRRPPGAADRARAPLRVAQLVEALEVVDDAVLAVRSRAAIAQAEPEAVAVCPLHSYRHPGHERAIGEALAQRLDAHVSLSHEVVGTFREFERAATSEVDAALPPLLARYLRRLLDAARDEGLPAPAIMQSSGGLANLGTAADHAALTILSGPAGGAAAAELLAERWGEPDLLCFDMGGTSCDVCVVEDGRVRETTARTVGGRPLALPMVDTTPSAPAAARSPGATPRRAARRPAERGGRARPPTTGAAGPSRPSPTPTCCSAT